MVLYIWKWSIHPDKAEEYMKWVPSAIKRTLEVPGVVEFRAYRTATGDSQIAATYEFADMVAWASWQSHEDVQKVHGELFTMASSVTSELWGPSPLVPKPIYGKSTLLLAWIFCPADFLKEDTLISALSAAGRTRALL